MSTRTADSSKETAAVALLPSVEAIDALPYDELVEFATRAATLHARAMARLAESARPERLLGDDEFLDARTLARLLHVSEPYVYELIKMGDLPAIAFGKYRRVRVADFRAWAERRRIDLPDYLTHRHRHERRGVDLSMMGGNSQNVRQTRGNRPARRGSAEATRRHRAKGGAAVAHEVIGTSTEKAEEPSDGMHS